MGAKVTIGCKLPAGHILELNIGKPNVQRVVLKGANDARIVGGYGFTQVESDFWEAWHKINKDLDFVKNGMVFVEKTENDAAAHAVEMTSEVSGFEGVDPKQAPKGITAAA